jgi:hypothetical protein
MIASDLRYVTSFESEYDSLDDPMDVVDENAKARNISKF